MELGSLFQTNRQTRLFSKNAHRNLVTHQPWEGGDASSFRHGTNQKLKRFAMRCHEYVRLTSPKSHSMKTTAVLRTSSSNGDALNLLLVYTFMAGNWVVKRVASCASCSKKWNIQTSGTFKLRILKLGSNFRIINIYIYYHLYTVSMFQNCLY